METKELVIDNRFRIQADTHLLTDLSSHTTTRLEPRLMKLLFLLATHAGQLVSREQIIRDIWNDYGGGEDGLTQAISFLRKMLDDVAKDRIRTIPKKGYLLNALVTPANNIIEAEEKEKISTPTHPPEEEERVSAALAEKKKSFWTHPAAITLAVLLPVCVLIAGRKTFFSSPVKSREPAGAVEDTLYQYQELKEQQQQQSANP